MNNCEYVKWFWKNGSESVQTNFGIEYNEGKDTFRPDFIVKFKNGNVGIFDTKPVDYNVEDTRVKAEALFRYLANKNINRGNRPKLLGGIVVEKGGVFYYYNQKEYVDMDTDSTNWKPFKELIDKIKSDTITIEYRREHYGRTY